MSDSPHILVVDDEEHLAIGIKFNLEAEGFQVSTAGNGPEALALLDSAQRPIDLIVLDLMLPGMSGYEVCEQLRASGNFMPVLMLSARTLTEDKTRGFDVGANQYLVKPFELEELLSRIKNLLAQHRHQQQMEIARPDVTEFEFGDAKINFKTHEAKVADEPIRMTQLQLKLLKYFIEHEGEVVPRSEILENVWELPGHVNTRAPDQVLRQLRKAFEPDPANPVYFLTIRDAGYRFVKGNPDATIADKAGQTESPVAPSEPIDSTDSD
ncbi:response regulator transcription factor [Mariniblastus fucicola]|uniref:Sensory transduction protein regX3 n=1 Tax=Mariniblastus fucicola TaxID=980251 RepID=A0A5B9PEX5_9BACT|nr:response regulator transcription factor [Mariniblastus fucicola]QEG21453.1 Sensory transduction protein regX3 [Mariniblastus fucicola]